jgi:hypothetical protein
MLVSNITHDSIISEFSFSVLGVRTRDIDNRDGQLPSQLKYHVCLLNLELVASKTY